MCYGVRHVQPRPEPTLLGKTATRWSRDQPRRGGMMIGVKRSFTPQKKKVLSYAKDGRNTVAESRSRANKAITKRKAKASRALRRAESVVSADARRDPDADVFVARARRKSWRKVPDAPLAEFVAARLRNRAAPTGRSIVCVEAARASARSAGPSK